MPDLVRHLASFARFSAHREQRERDDGDAMRELAGRPLELARGVELEWLGVAGYRLTYQGHTIYIDPYFSRVPLSSVVRRRPALANRALHEALLRPSGQVVGVLVGHTHFDHAIDVPELARRFECSAYGSSSLGRLMRLYGLGERAVEVVPERPYELGPFTVTFVPSLHSKLLLGYAVPFDGELTCEHLDALSPAAYRCGQVWGVHIEVAGMTFYHQGSANLIDDRVPSGGVDVFLAGIAGRSFTRDYWARILRVLEPRTVVASHFDDFFRPIEAPMGFSTNANLTAFPDEVAAVSRDFQVAALPLLEAVGSES
ncbi:MAG TPA: MBL fold metallo-hydrolase [Solirubrobacteraceae bacterium]|nr:MBL fold metallo-hydrolase [Solirubrobacteraceae bacterium]